jgi:protein-tyrosine phosphatase
METIEDLYICVDCAMFHANGETPVGLDLDEAVAWIESLDDSGHWVVGDEAGFSRSACHSCGSHLGGDRYQAAILIPA